MSAIAPLVISAVTLCTVRAGPHRTRSRANRRAYVRGARRDSRNEESFVRRRGE
jgi:hypothetical protein